MTPIDYGRIGRLVANYKLRGYEYIEVPWLVSQKSIDVTIPRECNRLDVMAVDPTFHRLRGCLIGSAEQAFLEIRNELCPARKYQTVTPCFRDERQDELHHPWFMKLELIIPIWKTDDADYYLKTMIDDARIIAFGMNAVQVKTDIGFDLTIAGIEVGSYGIREHEGFRWVYGTGLAEPRYSQAMAKWDAEQDAELDDLVREYKGEK